MNSIIIGVVVLAWILRKIKRKLRLARMSVEYSTNVIVERIKSVLETIVFIIALVAVVVWFIL